MASTPDLDELILLALQGRATAIEKRRLAARLDVSSENRAHFEELRRIWTVAERASPSVRSVRRPSPQELLGPIPTSASSPAPRPLEGLSRRSLWGFTLATAATISALLLGVHFFRTISENPDILFSVAEFSTGPREKVTVRLGDGSIVRLGPRSNLQVSGKGGERSVYLEGEAFFAVAHLESAPFTVRTRQGIATVLGTRFDVRAREDDLRLVVLDGRVRVEAGSAGQYSEEVGPSEMSSVVEGGRIHVSHVPDVLGLLEWMEDALIFQSTPLERVASEFEHRYGVPVLISDSGIAARTVTAWFTDEPLEHVVKVICRAAAVTCEVSESGVRIGI